MSRVLLLAGTRKGAFLLESDDARTEWTVRGPTPKGREVSDLLLDRFTGGDREVPVRADTAGECLDRLLDSHPALEPHLFDGRGRLRPHLLLFVDGRRVESVEQAADVPLDDGATVTVLRSVPGG